MTASAPGKAILFGEHAVVYGRPAIAVPVHALRAQAVLEAVDSGQPGELWIEAPDIEYAGRIELAAIDLPAGGRGNGTSDGSGEGGGRLNHGRDRASAERPANRAAGLGLAVRLGLQHFKAAPTAPLRLQVNSEIPVAAGMGSSAAVTVAVLRATAEFLAAQLPPEAASRLAYQVERHYHGEPSGIDNSVVAYGEPIYFVKGRAPAPIAVGRPFSLMLADTGQPAETRALVAGVRERWMAQRAEYDGIFDRIGALVERARAAIERGQVTELGPLMDRNQDLLERIGVSSPELEALIAAARAAGAQGAKLSGAGGGGSLVAFADPDRQDAIRRALQAAGAARLIVTEVGE